MANMLRVEPFGYQTFNWLAKQLITSVAEQALRLGIDQHDLAGAAGDDICVGGALEQDTKGPLDALKGVARGTLDDAAETLRLGLPESVELIHGQSHETARFSR